MKKFLMTAMILLAGISANAVTFDRYYPTEQIPPNGITLSAGNFLRVVNLRDINTFANDIGDECEFINTTDMFIGDVLVIPKNSHIYGVIEDIREPVQGNDAAIKIKVDKLVTADGDKTYYLHGHIFGANDNYIGGGQTNPAFYKTTPHYTEGWAIGILQLTPLNIYGYGKHQQIKAGDEVFIILERDLKIY